MRKVFRWLFFSCDGFLSRHRENPRTGCRAGDNEMRITDEENAKSYVISGATTDVKPGDRMRLLGKKVKPKDPDKTRLWEARENAQRLRRLPAPALMSTST
jgi:hypothetical protein